MKVLITGGAGYIGTELAIALNKMDAIDSVVIYDNLARRNYNLFLHSGIKRGKMYFEEGELLDSRRLDVVLQNVDVVVHLGARVESRLINASHHLYEQINNWGTAEVVYAVERSNSVKKFIYSSSIAVYGNADKPVNREIEPYPRTYYGSSKLRGEAHVQRLFPEKQAAILRLGNIYGYGTSFRKDTVINKFMFDASFKGKIQVNGKGTQKRGFIHIQKVVNVLEHFISNNFNSGVFDVIEHNLSVFEVTNLIKTQSIYPDCEIQFVNQHLELRNIEVIPDERISDILKPYARNISDEMIEFKNQLENSCRSC